MSGHGGFRDGSGRKRIYASQKRCSQVWQRGHHRISLDSILYSSWVAAKIKCGYTSDSQFASHLLSLERRRRETERSVPSEKRKERIEAKDGASAKRRRHLDDHLVATSTPLRPVHVSVQSPDLSVDITDAISEVDVTGITELSVNSSTYQVANNSVILQNDAEKYLESEELVSEDCASDEDDSNERGSTDALEDALWDLIEDHHHEEDCGSLGDTSDVDDLEKSMNIVENDYQNELQAEDSDSDSGLILIESQDRTADSTLNQVSTIIGNVTCTGPQQSSSTSGRGTSTVTFVPPELSYCTPAAQPAYSASVPKSSCITCPQDPRSSTCVPPPDFTIPQPSCSTSGSEASASTSLPAPVYPKLSRLEEQQNFKEELSLVQQVKVICSLDLLLAVFKKCQHPGCTNGTTINYHIIGTTAVIKWCCTSGHKGTFCSSKDLNEIYSNNLQVAASIMLSGNNFAKVEKLAHFLGLSFISNATFYRMQRLYFIPAISEWWSWQREQLLKEFVSEEVIICGDGQCDSPGHTAKNLCYFLMELVSGYIIEIEVRDKRHVGLTSTNMEKQVLQNALQRLQLTLNIVEVVTDASTTIKKLLADNFAALFHSLDIWHKAKSIRKCLVKSTWIGLLHHVCDEHEWVEGKCDHGELEDHSLPWFDRRDKDYEALQKIILEPQLLSSFKFYVRFRHTGSLECANSLSLVYTPKRCSYSYKAYKARKQLAAIDWNYHLNQPAATTKAGDLVVSRRYNQRTKEWNSKVVKVKKQYEYIAMLMARILRLRNTDVNKVTRNVSLNDSDPALLAPSIADKPPPPSKELFLARRSRFKTTNTAELSESCPTDEL